MEALSRVPGVSMRSGTEERAVLVSVPGRVPQHPACRTVRRTAWAVRLPPAHAPR